MIELSVHLITYNNESHIADTIESVLKQKTDFTYEIVVGDDCSTDKTFEILNTYAKTYPHLFNLKRNEKQLGILQNFKTTLDRCKGTYIFDIAGDDFLKKDYSLQKMVEVLKNDPSLGFVDSGFDTLYETRNKQVDFSNKKDIETSKKNYKNLLFLGKLNPIGLCFKKQFLYKYVDFDTYINMKVTIDDYPILVDLVMNSNFERIPESLHVYRSHDQSYSHKKDFNNHLFLKQQMNRLFEYFSNKYNYPKEIVITYHKNYYKELLFLAGYFENKEIGMESFKNIKTKSVKDYIHYFASQSTMFRKLISKMKIN